MNRQLQRHLLPSVPPLPRGKALSSPREACHDRLWKVALGGAAVLAALRVSGLVSTEISKISDRENTTYLVERTPASPQQKLD